MDSPIEQRIVRLEETIRDIRGVLARIQQRLTVTATLEQVERMHGELTTQMTQVRSDLSAKLELVRGRVESLPTSWTMVTAIVAGQVELAGLIAAVVFGMAYLMGRI